MEKKQYQQPEMQVYGIKPTSVIATSEVAFSYDGSGDPYEYGR